MSVRVRRPSLSAMRALQPKPLRLLGQGQRRVHVEAAAVVLQDGVGEPLPYHPVQRGLHLTRQPLHRREVVDYRGAVGRDAECLREVGQAHGGGEWRDAAVAHPGGQLPEILPQPVDAYIAASRAPRSTARCLSRCGSGIRTPGSAPPPRPCGRCGLPAPSRPGARAPGNARSSTPPAARRSRRSGRGGRSGPATSRCAVPAPRCRAPTLPAPDRRPGPRRRPLRRVLNGSPVSSVRP